MQELADGLTPARILLFLSKWQNRLPGPFTVREQRAGYRYRASMCQVEFARTHLADRQIIVKFRGSRRRHRLAEISGGRRRPSSRGEMAIAPTPSEAGELVRANPASIRSGSQP
jgi:hypothetical protein